MLTYTFRAIDSAGALHRGELRSDSRTAALQALNQRGLIPIEISASASSERVSESATIGRPLLRLLTSRSKMTTRELLNLTESLAALLTAGLTIDRALQVSAALMTANAARASVDELLSAIRSGKTLQRAFAARRERLPPYYLSMIEAGEVGGSLPETLTQLGQLMRREFEVRERVRSALFYPLILAVMVLTTLTLLLAFVLPRFQLMFAETSAKIPVVTQIALTTGAFISNHGWWILIVLAGLTAGAILWLRSNRGRLTFDRWSLSSRLTAQLPAALNTARLFRTLSTLCRNGLSLPSALKVSRGTVVNRWLFKVLDDAIRDVQSGEPLSASLNRAGVFPLIAVHLTRVGEETGHLHDMLQSAALTLETDSQVRLERILTMIVPAAIILMGLIIATLISSVFIGLLSINNLAT